MWAAAIALLQLFTTLVTFGIVRPKQSRFPRVLSDIHQVYDALHGLTNATGACRAVVLKTENGGGIPRIGRPLYSSILYEVFVPPAKLLRKGWQQQQIDEGYTSMLLDVLAKGTVIVETRRMPKSQLRTMYEANQVWRSVICLLVVEERRLICLSLNFIHPDGPEEAEVEDFSSDQVEAIRFGVSRIRTLFQESPGEL